MHSNPDTNHHHRNGAEEQRREAQLGEWGVAGLELAPKTETLYYPIQRSWTPLHNNKKNDLRKTQAVKVEVAGVEPASKQGTPELSTCLADHLILLLEPGRRQPNPSPSP